MENSLSKFPSLCNFGVEGIFLIIAEIHKTEGGKRRARAYIFFQILRKKHHKEGQMANSRFS